MGNPIKYSTSVTSGSYQKGNTAIGVNSINYGPTPTTGWYNSPTPTGGNFIVTEVVDGNTPPRFYAPSTLTDWVNLAKQEGATGANTGSIVAVKNWFASQANYVISNMDFSSSLPNIVGNGLNLNINPQFAQSYPGTGTAWTDISGLGNNQILVNNPTYNSGLKTLVFDGVDDGAYGDSTNDAGLTNEITMEALFYNTNGSSDRAIIMNKENTYEFAVNNSTGQLQWAIASPGPGWAWFGSGADVRNKWTHGVVTRSSDGTERSYVNGVLITTQGGTAGNITLQTNRLNIAGRGGGTSFSSNFGGQIANVKRYFKALSQAEILQNYHQGNIVTDGLVLSMDAGNLVSYASGSTTSYSLTGSLSGSLLNGLSFINTNGGVWDLDGADDRIALGYQSTLNNLDITQEAWVKADTMYSWSGIISNMPSWGTGFSLQIGPIQNIAAMVSGQYLTTSWAPKTGVWYHIMATHRNSDNLNVLYVNGVQENSFIRSISYSTNAVTEIGVFYTGGQLPLDGKIGLVRTYNRALTAAEVLQNFNAQRSRFEI